MRNEVLQVFAMCLHTGPFLAGESEKPPELFGSHSTFKCVNAVSFERAGQPTRDGAIADRIVPWARRLKSEGVNVIRPFFSGCPHSDKSDTTAKWGLITDGDRGMEIWQPLWKARVIARDDTAPFKVVYTASKCNRWSVAIPGSISSAAQGLEEAWQAILEFAEPFSEPMTAATLRRLLEAHQVGLAETPGFDDLIPAGYDEEIAGWAASAFRAVCFFESATWIAIQTQNPEAEKLGLQLWTAALTTMEAVVAGPRAERERLAS